MATLRAVEGDITRLSLSPSPSPCINTGVYGYPSELAADAAIAAVREFIRSPSSLREVIFCCYSANDRAHYQSRLGHTES